MDLKNWIHWKRLKQGEAAKMFGCTDAMLSQILSGQRFPSRKLALRIEQATGGRVKRMKLLYPDEKAA